MTTRARPLAVLSLVSALACVGLADPRLGALPDMLRPEAAAILAEADPAHRARRARAFARAHPREGLDFSLRLLERDPDVAVRLRLTKTLGSRRDAAIVAALERRVRSDPSTLVALQALRELERSHASGLLARVEERLVGGPPAGPEERARLYTAQDGLATRARGGMLPGFLRVLERPFVVPAADDSVRIVAFGDFGNESGAQRAVARAMADAHALEPFDLGITLGDNFYPDGVVRPDDARFERGWGALYGGLGIPIFASLGNHDWGHPDSPAAQILRGMSDDSFRLPAARFSFVAGPVQLFAIDTTTLSRAALDWLSQGLAASRSPWKVVYGHHPIRSRGAHGDSERLVRDLLPVLEGRAQLYVAGHDHDLQHLGPERGVHLVVSGGGGARTRPLRDPAQHPPGTDVRFARASHGFAVIEATLDALDLRFIDALGAELYRARLRRSPR